MTGCLHPTYLMPTKRREPIYNKTKKGTNDMKKIIILLTLLAMRFASHALTAAITEAAATPSRHRRHLPQTAARRKKRLRLGTTPMLKSRMIFMPTKRLPATRFRSFFTLHAPRRTVADTPATITHFTASNIPHPR